MEIRKISEIKLNPNNPRLIKDDKFKKLVQSIKDFPEMLNIRPIVVNSDMVILGGNMRYKACKEAGIKEIPIIITDLSEEKQREFLIKDNTSGGEWDWEVLANEWDNEELESWGLDIPSFEVDDVLEAEEDDFDTTPPEEPKTVLGDLYEIGEHRLLCGDSTDSDQVAKLMNGEKVDMVFTSPPYNGNTGADRDNKKNMKGLYLDNETDNKTSDEYIKFNADIFNTIKTIASKDCVILYNINYNRNSPSEYVDVVNECRNVFNLVETIVWEKQLAISLQGNNLTRIYEFIFVLFNGNDKPNINKGYTECEKNLWKISNIGANNENHSACFPIKLVDKAINLYGKNNAILYEPFTGSGTTMVASHQLKRKCYGMELDPKYCDVIVRRMLKLDDTLTVKRNGVDVTNDWK